MPKFRNEALVEGLKTKEPKSNLVAANKVPKPNARNMQGHAAYKLDNFMLLLTQLNTLKLENQYYKNAKGSFNDVVKTVKDCASQDPYLTAQCIIYSRCVRTDGLRSVNQLAAAVLAGYVSGQDWSKRFYSNFNKKLGKGGVIYRADDMAEMNAVFEILNNGKGISNAMKKGFKSALENLDTYTVLKYKSSLVDIINIVHPNPKASKAMVEVVSKDYVDRVTELAKATKLKAKKAFYNAKLEAFKGKYPTNTKIPVLEAVMLGMSVSADTWEVANSDAGQIVAKAVKEGKLSKAEAETVLNEAKESNWNGLLKENKLGILAAIRNMRSILNTNPSDTTIKMLCDLVSDKTKILQGKIMPYQLDMANEVMLAEFDTKHSRALSQALLKGYEEALPNMKDLLDGESLVIIDMSGSMSAIISNPDSKSNIRYKKSCMDKASLIGATLAKALNSDVIRFGDDAEYVKYNSNQDVFSLAKSIQKNMGCTSLASAWKAAQKSGRKYKRVFILSDNECNKGNTYTTYKSYLESTGDPYVYSVDLAAYGTVAMAGEKVKYYYGFSYSMFEDIAREFNPAMHLEEVKKIVI